MSNDLRRRIDRLEDGFPVPGALPRVFRMLARSSQTEDPRRLALDAGFDPDTDILIMRLVTTPQGRPSRDISPRILGGRADDVR